MMSLPADFEIVPATAALARQALALVLGEIPTERRQAQVERIVAAAAAGESDLDGLLIARSAGQLLAAIWARRLPGRVATVWPPVTLAEVPPEVSAECLAGLARAAIEYLSHTEVRLAQVLVPSLDGEAAAALAAAGFEPLADLLYMVSLAADFPSVAPASPLVFEPIEAPDEDHLADLLEQTYEGTHDCPRLNGVRDVRDVIAGYEGGTGQMPPWWYFVRRDGHDIGCLLLVDEPADDQCELVYAGLIPAARRRGLGRALVRFAQWTARAAGRSRLALVVDAANLPAVKTYAAAGFQTWNRRSALVRIFPRVPS